MTKQRRSSHRLELESGALLACQILDAEGLRTIAAGEILDLSERGVGIRLPRQDDLGAERGSKFVLRSALPGTAWSMRRYAEVSHRRAFESGVEILGLGWCDEAPQGPNYSNLQRWRYESFLGHLRKGRRPQGAMRDLLEMLDRRISSERSSLLEWIRGSAVALDALCVESESARQKPLVKPLAWHEDVFELVDPRFPERPCQGRVLERRSSGFDALVAVAAFPSSLRGRELWALHRGTSPGQRRRLRLVATQAHRVCQGLWQVSLEAQQRKLLPSGSEIASTRPTAASGAR